MTIPEFAYQQGMDRLAALPPPPDHVERWQADSQRIRSALADQILGGFPPRGPLSIESNTGKGTVSFRITTEEGIRATGEAAARADVGTGTVIIAIPGSKSQPGPSGPDGHAENLPRPWLDLGFATLKITDSRFTPLEVSNVAPVAGVADHNPAEWGLWINRPLLGQWTWDLIRWLDFLDEQARLVRDRGEPHWKPARPYVLHGIGAMSLPAILAGGIDARVAGVHCQDCLVSFVGRPDKPWSGHPMGILAHRILDLADVGQLAALLAPRPFALASAAEPHGEPAVLERIRAAFRFTQQIYELHGAAVRLKLGERTDLRIFAGKA